MKKKSIQDNLVRKILEGIDDGTEGELINLDLSKVFDSVDHLFLVTVLETARFKLEFCKWISSILVVLACLVKNDCCYCIAWMVVNVAN